MVKGITNRIKRYVDVLVKCDSDGNESPVAIFWEDGTRYDIQRVVGKMPRAAMKVGGHGMCYTVLVNNKETRIWHDAKGWFVEEKMNHGLTAM